METYYFRHKEEVKRKHHEYYLSHKKEHRERGRRWAKANPEKIREYQRKLYPKQKAKQKEYKRQHTLVVNGKVIYGINKREYPKDYCCELCHGSNGSQKSRLHYHHWNDDKPELGIWVCMPCHSIVEAFEKNILEVIIENYKIMKEKIIGQQKVNF